MKKIIKPLIVSFFISLISFFISYICFANEGFNSQIGSFISFPFALVFGAGYGGGTASVNKAATCIFIGLWLIIFFTYLFIRLMRSK